MNQRLIAGLAVIAALIVNWLILELAKAKRGATMKYGSLGLTLILLPNAMSWVVFPRAHIYFACLFVAAAIGCLVLIWDLTTKQAKEPAAPRAEDR